MTLFELGVITISLAFLVILNRFDSRIWKKFAITFIGVLLFEYFTQAMWLNLNLEKWAYLYLDVSWVITIGWTTIILVSISIIDMYFPKDTERERFFLYFIPITIIGIIAEAVVLGLGIRQYPPEVIQILSGFKILGQTPIEALYYIPVFMLLVLSFARYWELALGENIQPANMKVTNKEVKQRGKK